jgi:hypothetical protein
MFSYQFGEDLLNRVDFDSKKQIRGDQRSDQRMNQEASNQSINTEVKSAHSKKKTVVTTSEVESKRK